MRLGRIRLSPQQIVLAIATALVFAANLYFGVTYVDARQQRQRLSDQYHSLEASLQRLVAVQKGPTASDGSAIGALVFPSSLSGVELTDLVIRSARDSGVEVLSLRSVAAPDEAIGTGAYRALRVDLRLRADRDSTTRFLQGIERGGLHTIVLDDLALTSDGGRDELGVRILAYATNALEAK